jgi:hypothetical protein
MKKEDSLQKTVCNYLRMQYTQVLFNSDASGLRLPIGLARKQMDLRSGKGFPDLVIYEPRNSYHALFIELKIKSPFKKDGTLLKDEHLEEQLEMHNKLRKLGYACEFVWDFDMAKRLIDEYLK